MIYLLEYSRAERRIISSLEFADEDRPKAENERLRLVLELNHRGIDHDVVVLEAASLEALRKTHRRYFGDFTEEEIREIVNSVENGHS